MQALVISFVASGRHKKKRKMSKSKEMSSTDPMMKNLTPDIVGIKNVTWKANLQTLVVAAKGLSFAFCYVAYSSSSTMMVLGLSTVPSSDPLIIEYDMLPWGHDPTHFCHKIIVISCI